MVLVMMYSPVSVMRTEWMTWEQHRTLIMIAVVVVVMVMVLVAPVSVS